MRVKGRVYFSVLVHPRVHFVAALLVGFTITRQFLELRDTLEATENAGLVVRYYQVMVVA